MGLKPFYKDDHVTLYHGDALKHPELWVNADVLVTDPPYGINYRSSAARVSLPRSIHGDQDTTVRDTAVKLWGTKPALLFGTWRAPYPAGTRQKLVWDTKGALGMGAIDLPWKPASQEIYVLGTGFTGKRTTDVLVHPPVQSLGTNGRVHPHQKPVGLLVELINKCPPGVIVDPFAGSGSTLVAAKQLGRVAVGFEIDEAYCKIAANRLTQDVLNF